VILSDIFCIFLLVSFRFRLFVILFCIQNNRHAQQTQYTLATTMIEIIKLSIIVSIAIVSSASGESSVVVMKTVGNAVVGSIVGSSVGNNVGDIVVGLFDGTSVGEMDGSLVESVGN